MKKKAINMLYILIGISIFWIGLTIWVQYDGKSNNIIIRNKSDDLTALIIYNPDPIYNLYEQVCRAFAEGLLGQDISSKIISVDYRAENFEQYNLIVFCANTYNWSPDWQIISFIEQLPNLKNKNVVAITLGSGSTVRAKQKLESIIIQTKSNLLSSREFWLLRPNDENRTDEKNTKVAIDMAKEWGNDMSKILENI